MKRVMMFGPNSKDKALKYARGHYRTREITLFRYPRVETFWHERETHLIVLCGRDRRYAVCNFNMALKLEKQGFRAV